MPATSQSRAAPSTRGAMRASNPGVIGVDPVAFGGRQKGRVDQAAVKRNPRQGFKSQHLTLGIATRNRRDVLHHDQVFDADAEGPFAVIARFVRQDHARFQRRCPTRAIGAAGLRGRTDRRRRRARCRGRNPARPSRAAKRASASRCCPRRPSGNRARQIAIMPCRTRVIAGRGSRRAAPRSRCG